MITMKTKSTHTVSSVADATGGIWCGTDFTPASEVAVDVATDFARRLDTPLTLAHVFEMPRALRGDAKASRWLQASRKRTLRETADASRKRGVAVTESVSSGRMAETIIQKAAAEKAQLIVVPSANGRRLNKWIPHSGAKRTPGRADSPMLVVRKAEPLRVWLRGKKPLKIFVAFDFTASAEAALRWAKTLTAIGPCEVVLGYINNAVDDHIRVGTAGRIPFGGNPPEVLAILERDMKKRSGDLLGSSTVRCRIEDHTGSVEDRLMAMAAEEDADLIIVGSRKRSRWQRLVNPSVSRRLLRGVGTNLAIVPFVPEKMSPDKLPMVRHVLVATDLSEVGNTAIPHAYSLVKGGGIVTLLHVVTPPVSPVLADRFPGSLPLVHDEVNAAEAAKVAAKLRSLVPSGTSALGVNTQVKVISNRQAGLAIAQAAERLGVDVVCIASRERSELRKLMFGSVAVEVISRVRRPVFVVRAPAC